MRTIDCKGSSNLVSADYNADAEELTLAFQNGTTYVYDGIPQSMADAFASAPSKGSYLAQQIKPNFAARRTV